MRIDFDDEEYPELARYLENPKRKMKFLYFLEELFTQNSFDPMFDGLKLRDPRYGYGNDKQDAIKDALQDVYPYFDKIAEALATLGKNMEGSVIGRFPTEHVVHEVVQAPLKEQKTVEMDDTDYSSTEGIDFGPAIAMFEE